ncbi:glycosyltransferase family 2 protein [Frigidibacter oleivorans]|uniref:glycosyltransferase family 2 protein n=1 Tax=Frigidibacter oleivorans TaxID=2487129 RepID=UPI000F8D0B63|nr:glycosyltransferase [Frigidibacter oleivorans]
MTPSVAPGTILLQAVILPDPEICSEPDLFVHLGGIAGLDLPRRQLQLGSGGWACFDSYFNLLSLAKWQEAAPFGHLGLVVELTGLAELRVWHAPPGRSWDMLDARICTGGRVELDLTAATAHPAPGVIFFELRALADTVLTAAGYVTRDPLPPPQAAGPEEGAAARALPKLALCLTTFRREEEIRRTAARLEAFIEASPWRDRMQVFVVDNGGTAALPPLAHVERIANRNLGGAGGFARGLAEAQAWGFSHCLFMDDDAAVPVEAIHRTFVFLARARDPATAIAGAMISTAHRWALWEAGAVFDRRCRPLQGGTDLRRREAVFALEQATGAAPPGFYGGFWFFAFPVAAVRHWPFPFFVRGDDVMFSLSNPFRFVRLNGVVSFQQDFTEKESPLTAYLDLRSHMVHHLALPGLRLGRWRMIRLPLGFLARSLSRFHYDSAEAQLLAWADVLEGPDFFARNSDMATRRGTIAALVRDEAWGSRAGPPPRRCRIRGRRMDRLLRATLNGHFLPFARIWAGRARRPAGARGDVEGVLGSQVVTYERPGEGLHYTVRRSDRRCLTLLWRAAGLALRHLRGQAALQATYAEALSTLTDAAFWQGQFGAAPEPAMTASLLPGAVRAADTEAIVPRKAAVRAAERWGEAVPAGTALPRGDAGAAAGLPEWLMPFVGGAGVVGLTADRPAGRNAPQRRAG